MNKEDIINYVMETPGNSNPAVLGSMLESYGSGSDGGVMWVTLTVNQDTGAFSVDKTNAEILSAVNSGKMVFCKDVSGGGDRIIPIFSLTYLNSTLASFSATQYSDGNGYSSQIDIQDGVVKWTYWTWTVHDDS